MSNLKHVGRMAKNKRKIVVAYNVIPGDPDSAVVVTTENLDAGEHDTLMKLVESEAGQRENIFADAMSRTVLPDGRNMLAAFHTTGKMVKVSTSDVEMVPNRNSTILLSELNELIAQQRGVTVADLAPKGNTTQKNPEPTAPVVEQIQETAPTSELLTDDDLAAKYRSDADRLFKEAKRLREQAEELSPTKRKTKTEQSA